MKKMAALLLALVMLASILTACGKSSDTKTEEPVESTDTVIDPTVPEADAPDEVEAPAEEPQEESKPEEAGPVNILESPQVVFDQEGVQVVIESIIQDGDEYTVKEKVSNNNPDNKRFHFSVALYPNGLRCYVTPQSADDLYAGDEVEEEVTIKNRDVVSGNSAKSLVEALLTNMMYMNVVCRVSHYGDSAADDEDYTNYAELHTIYYDEVAYENLYGEKIGEINVGELVEEEQKVKKSDVMEWFLECYEDTDFISIDVFWAETDDYYVLTFKHSRLPSEIYDLYMPMPGGLPLCINNTETLGASEGLVSKLPDSKDVRNDIGITHLYFDKETFNEDNMRKWAQIPNGDRVFFTYSDRTDIMSPLGGICYWNFDKDKAICIDPFNKEVWVETIKS